MDWLMLSILLGVLLLIPTAYAGIIGAPYAPTRLAAVKKAFEVIALGKNDVIVDLGAGDGKIVLAAASRGARAHGFELSPLLWVVAWLRTRASKLITLHYRNFYRATLPANTTVIFLFLMPRAMERVTLFLKQQQLPHARYVLSYAFRLLNQTPLTIVREPNCAPLYIYRFKDLIS